MKLTDDQKRVLRYMANHGRVCTENHSIALALRFYPLSASKRRMRDGLKRCSIVCRQLIAKGALERAGWIGSYRITDEGEWAVEDIGDKAKDTE